MLYSIAQKLWVLSLKYVLVIVLKLYHQYIFFINVSGEIFLRDEILAYRSLWRLVEKEVKEPPLRSSGFSSEFAKFLKNNTDGETKPVKDFVTRKIHESVVLLVKTNFYSSNPELLLTKLQLTKFDEYVLG